MHTASIETSDGIFTAHFSSKGLAALRFPSRPETSSPRDALISQIPFDPPEPSPPGRARLLPSHHLSQSLFEHPQSRTLAHFSPSPPSPLLFPSSGGEGQGEGGTTHVPSPLEERRDLSKWLELTSRAVQQVLAGRPTDELPPLDLSEGTDFQRRVWQAMSRIPIGRTMSYGQLAEQMGAPKAVRAVGGACGANAIPLLIPCHRVLAANGRLGGFSGGLSWKMLLLKREMIAFLLPAANASKASSHRSPPLL